MTVCADNCSLHSNRKAKFIFTSKPTSLCSSLWSELHSGWVFWCSSCVSAVMKPTMVSSCFSFRTVPTLQSCSPAVSRPEHVEFIHPNRYRWTQSHFPGAGYNQNWCWNCGACLFLQHAWTQALTPSVTTQLPDSFLQLGVWGKMLACSDLHTDFEIINAITNSCPESDLWSDWLAYSLFLLDGVWVGLHLSCFWLRKRSKYRCIVQLLPFSFAGERKNSSQLPLASNHYIPSVLISTLSWSLQVPALHIQPGAGANTGESLKTLSLASRGCILSDLASDYSKTEISKLPMSLSISYFSRKYLPDMDHKFLRKDIHNEVDTFQVIDIL